MCHKTCHHHHQQQHDHIRHIKIYGLDVASVLQIERKWNYISCTYVISGHILTHSSAALVNAVCSNLKRLPSIRSAVNTRFRPSFLWPKLIAKPCHGPPLWATIDRKSTHFPEGGSAVGVKSCVSNFDMCKSNKLDEQVERRFNYSSNILQTSYKHLTTP